MYNKHWAEQFQDLIAIPQNLNVKKKKNKNKTNGKTIYLCNLTSYKKFLLLLTEAILQLEQNCKNICENWTHTKELTNLQTRSVKAHNDHINITLHQQKSSVTAEDCQGCWSISVFIQRLQQPPQGPSQTLTRCCQTSVLCSSLLPGQWRAGILQRLLFQRIY